MQLKNKPFNFDLIFRFCFLLFIFHIFCLFRVGNLSMWKLLYTTYIRPHLEFAVSAWNPYLKDDIDTLKSVQRRVTKTVTSIQHLPYEKRCKAFTKLDLKRTRGDLLQMYKLSTKLDTIEWHTDQIVREPRGGHRGLLVRVVVKICNIRHNFFTNRVVNPWNYLPDEIVEAQSVNSFKKKLDKFMATSSFLPNQRTMKLCILKVPNPLFNQISFPIVYLPSPP